MELEFTYDVSNARMLDEALIHLKKISEDLAICSESNQYEGTIRESMKEVSQGIEDVIHDSSIESFLEDIYEQLEKIS